MEALGVSGGVWDEAGVAGVWVVFEVFGILGVIAFADDVGGGGSNGEVVASCGGVVWA